MTKQPITIKQALIGLIVAIMALFSGNAVVDNIGGGRDSDFNRIDNLTSISTTTTTYLPVKLLSLDANRRYAVISNVSDTAIYLYATTADLRVDNSGGTPATSTITSLNGIYVGATSNFTFDTENMVYSNIWASSTAASKQINVNYK